MLGWLVRWKGGCLVCGWWMQKTIIFHLVGVSAKKNILKNKKLKALEGAGQVVPCSTALPSQFASMHP